MTRNGKSLHTLFASSCGSVEDFTDIQQDAVGNLAITYEMQCYNFSVRRLNGDFYAHVYPFNNKFYRKVHSAGTLLFSGVHSYLMLLQNILIHLPLAKEPIWVISEVPKYWLEYDGTMCLDEAHRWKSPARIKYLRTRGLDSVPNSIKAIIGNLVSNGTRSRASNNPLLVPTYCNGLILRVDAIYIQMALLASLTVFPLECKIRWSLTYVATPIAVAVRGVLFTSSGLTNLTSRGVQPSLQCTALLCLFRLGSTLSF